MLLDTRDMREPEGEARAKELDNIRSLPPPPPPPPPWPSTLTFHLSMTVGNGEEHYYFDCWVLFSRQGAETPAAGILEYGPPGYPPVGFPQALRHQWSRCGGGPTGQTPV